MALPTISHNSPSAGYISWTQFGMSYGGVSYTIPAGNSNKKFVWWAYGGGTPTIQGADTLPTLGNDDCLLFLNKSGVGVLVPTTDVVDGSLVVAGSIFSDAIAANQISTWHLQANSVTSNVIASNAITANHISAGAITTNKLSVGSVGEDAVANGSFEDGTEGWLRDQGNGTTDVVTGVASGGAYALRLIRNTANEGVRQDPRFYIPVTPTASRRWYVSARAGAGVALANGFYLRVYWYQADKVTAASTAFNDVAANAALTTSWGVFEGQVVPPANARYMALGAINANGTSTMYVDQMSAREVVVSAQIGDGQISTAKLAANAVTANTIASNAITTRHLIVADMENLFAGSDFENAAAIPWTLDATGYVRDTARFYKGTASLRVSSAAPASTTLQRVIPVVEGDKFYIGFYASRDATWNGTSGNSKLRFGDQNGVHLLSVDFALASLPLADTWYERGDILTIPAGVTSLQVTLNEDATTGNAWLDNMAMRRMNAGELLVDGAITAEKIGANAVTANAIGANVITGLHIGAEQITGNNIDANTITGFHIKANSIGADRIVAGSIGVNEISPALGNELDISANEEINLIVGRIDTNAQGVKLIADEQEEMVKYFKFSPEQGAIIGTPTSPFSVRLDNNRIEMRENGIATSWWENQEMHVNSFIGTVVQLGNHQLEKTTSGTIVRAL